MSKGQAKAGFDAKKYAVNGVTEDEVNDAKKSFDLFDADQGGSVDINGTKATTQSSRQPWSPSDSRPRTAPSST